MTPDQGKYGFSLKVEHLPADVLKPSRWNPNALSPENEVKLEESLKRFGFFKPALVRQLDDGSLEIVGGEHRIAAAKRIGHKDIPVINLGKIDDKRAKELCLLDNGRYGADDTLQLSALLEELGSPEDLASFMPYTESDLNSIFASSSIDLDALEIPENEELPKGVLPEKAVQTHQIMRFKVPIEDAATITALVEHTMKAQGFSTEDSLTNAGNALVHLLLNRDK